MRRIILEFPDENPSGLEAIKLEVENYHRCDNQLAEVMRDMTTVLGGMLASVSLSPEHAAMAVERVVVPHLMTMIEGKKRGGVQVLKVDGDSSCPLTNAAEKGADAATKALSALAGKKRAREESDA